MKIIVVGARGYIGAKLLKAAEPRWHCVGTFSNARDNITRFDLENVKSFNFRLIDAEDIVFLTAAISSPDICAKEPARAWNANVVGTSRFIDGTLNRGAKLVFFSSDTVYGEQNSAFDEHMSCSPAGDYAKMKHEVERRYLGAKTFKALRLSYIFSAQDKFTQYLMRCAHNGVPAEIFTPFDRAVVHRDDVVAAALSLVEKWDDIESPIINVGGPQVISRVQFAEIIRGLVLPNLTFKIIEPSAEFFANRPRVIRMQSPHMTTLLGRSACSLAEAAEIESERLREFQQ